MSEDKEKQLSSLPLLPLKNSVLFPGLLMPLAVGRSGSLGAVEKALTTEEKQIVVVAQSPTPSWNAPWNSSTRLFGRWCNSSYSPACDRGSCS